MACGALAQFVPTGPMRPNAAADSGSTDGWRVGFTFVVHAAECGAETRQTADGKVPGGGRTTGRKGTGTMGHVHLQSNVWTWMSM